jgi:hypothetical protein
MTTGEELKNVRKANLRLASTFCWGQYINIEFIYSKCIKKMAVRNNFTHVSWSYLRPKALPPDNFLKRGPLIPVIFQSFHFA